MLFDSLDKLKRNSIMSAILLIALGVIIMICPNEYIPSLTLVFGYTLLVVAIVIILNFFSGKKSLMEYLKFSGALVLGIVGVCVLVFRSDIMHFLAWLFGFLMILDGGGAEISVDDLHQVIGSQSDAGFKIGAAVVHDDRARDFFLCPGSGVGCRGTTEHHHQSKDHSYHSFFHMYHS